MTSRVQHHNPTTTGERIADKVAQLIGSWRFIIIQTIMVILWVVVNILGFTLRWDPYPFILLNLMFSVQAAYTGPILLLASNRQSQKDRALAAKDDEELSRLLTISEELHKLQLEQMQSHGNQLNKLDAIISLITT